MLRSELRPGDIGGITALHGVVYATEYGWDTTFEAYVAEHLGAFARRYGAGRECIWIAERAGEIVGCIAIVEAEPEAAQLRWFLVRADARGGGLGRTLLRHAVQFSRAAGYRRIFLHTVRDLTGAARLYTAAGFTITSEETHRRWGSELTEQRYDLVFEGGA
jgi:N-acetylglutamate synthase-like GNAT family acetyltransferase